MSVDEHRIDGKNLAIQISKIRTQMGLTQEELAYRCGVSRNTVISWENGSKRPNSSRIPALCKALGCAPEKLLGDEDQTDVSQMAFLGRGTAILQEVASSFDSASQEEFLQMMGAWLNTMKRLKASLYRAF